MNKYCNFAIFPSDIFHKRNEIQKYSFVKLETLWDPPNKKGDPYITYSTTILYCWIIEIDCMTHESEALYIFPKYLYCFQAAAFKLSNFLPWCQHISTTQSVSIKHTKCFIFTVFQRNKGTSETISSTAHFTGEEVSYAMWCNMAGQPVSTEGEALSLQTASTYWLLIPWLCEGPLEY